MDTLSNTVKSLRKQFNMTQEDLSIKSGVGLRFVRDLEQGKPTLRLDKVNQLLDFFNYEMVPQPKQDKQKGNRQTYITKIYWLEFLRKGMKVTNSFIFQNI